MFIRETTPLDLNDILFVEREAFQKQTEADLTRNLLADPTAKPLLSLLAYVENQPAGHILFTKATISKAPNVKVSLLAPLAVVPKFQRQGIGGALIRKGLELLSNQGVDLVFVLGHPTYYPLHGFTPAGKLGFEAPYPIPEKDADAWMVQALKPYVIGSVSGKVSCSDVLNAPEYWRE
ncbi:MAG: GNAT family N-acetyltransferase [Candidatus Bathyarchaeia archaeon]|jgi:putative acetyltransferase